MLRRGTRSSSRSHPRRCHHRATRPGTAVLVAALLHATSHLEDLQSPLLTFGPILLGAALITLLPVAVSRGVAGSLVVLACGLLALFVIGGLGQDAEILVLTYLVVLVAGAFTLPPENAGCSRSWSASSTFSCWWRTASAPSWRSS